MASSSSTRHLVLALLTLLLLLMTGGCGTRRPPMNVFIVCIDAVRYDTFWLPEAAGVPDSLTPWTSKAIRYRNAYSPSSWTVPAVASVLSGLYPIQHGAGSFSEAVANFETTGLPHGLPPSVETIAEALSARGYETAAIFANPFIGVESGIMQGFRSANQYDGYQMFGRTAIWLEPRRPDRPFLFYLQTMDAHHGHWNPLPEVTARAALVPEGIRSHVTMTGQPPGCLAGDVEWCARYLAYVESVLKTRRTLAGILDLLNAGGFLQNTIVIVYADHGEEFRDDEVRDRRSRQDPRGFYGAGHGHNLSEPVIRVPLLIWHPEEKGTDVQELVSLVDIVPTLRQWLRLPSSKGESGTSIAPEDLKNLGANRAVYSSGIAYGSPQFAVRWGDWKRIEFSCPPSVVAYELRRDPKETSPIARSAAPRRLEQLAADYRKLPTHATAPMAEMSEEQIAQLRALGYLQPGTRPAKCEETPSPSTTPSPSR